MESDGQKIIRRKTKRLLKFVSIFIVIMMLLIKNDFFKCYATTAVGAIKYKSEEDTNIFGEIKKGILDTLNIKVKGYAIVIQDNIFGYVESEAQKDEILQMVCEKYIEQLNNNCEGEKYYSANIKVNTKIEAVLEKVKSDELSESSEIAKKIYEVYENDKDLLNLQFEVNSYSTIDIEPEIVVEYDSDLYMGESKTIDGVNGEKIVYKE